MFIMIGMMCSCSFRDHKDEYKNQEEISQTPYIISDDLDPSVKPSDSKDDGPCEEDAGLDQGPFSEDENMQRDDLRTEEDDPDQTDDLGQGPSEEDYELVIDENGDTLLPEVP